VTGTDYSALPWVLPEKDRGFGSKSGQGWFSVPSVGTELFVYFQDGDPHHPLYTGSLLKKGNLPATFVTHYPYRYGFVDPAGNTFYIDTKPGSVTLSFSHKSGATITIADDGAVAVTSPTTVSVTSTGNMTLSSNADVTITATNKLTLNSNGAAAQVNTTELKVSGDIRDLFGTNTRTVAGMRTQYNGHTHSGVQAGPNNTGAPNTSM
jgi:hypothetical protein